MGSFRKNFGWMYNLRISQIKKLTKEMRDSWKHEEMKKEASTNLQRAIRGELKGRRRK